ncbi:MAG: glycosyltransferase family A protein [Longicatena sp.]
MKISVVIPAYNVEDVLEDALHSVLTQTKLNYIYEIIIVNDGSADATLDKMKELKASINTIPIVLISQNNRGASSARNAGMKIAQGDWIALLDADDEWLPNKIEVQVNTIMNHPEIDFLGCQHNDKQLRIGIKKITKLYHVSIKDLCIKSFPVTPAILFKKSILDKVGYFDEHQRYCEDSNFCLRVCEQCHFYQLPDSLVRIGHGKPSIGFSGLSSNIKGMNEGFKKNMKEVRKKGLISLPFYWFISCFNFMKYIRRILIVKLRSK